MTTPVLELARVILTVFLIAVALLNWSGQLDRPWLRHTSHIFLVGGLLLVLLGFERCPA